MTDRTPSVFTARVFILLNALIWLTLGVLIVFNVHPALPDEPLLKGLMAFLSLVTAGLLLGLSIFLGRRGQIVYFLTLGLLIITAILIVFDDFGVIDLIVLVINLIPITLLIKDKDWYLQPRSDAIGRQ
jgi:lysylphosphatidylglycerol synthetase-like protein (DUF2156 family)